MPITSLTLTNSPLSLNCVTPSGLEPISPLWLRERTQDPQQLDALTCQRLFDSHRTDPDLTLVGARPLSDTQTEFSFSDGHVEVYDLGALASEIEGDSNFPEAIAWDSGINQTAQRFDWHKQGDNEAFHKALTAYLQFGYIILTGVPTDRERILEVGSHFGYVKETNFGRYFEVYSRPAGNDLAYRSVALGPHTDNPYRSPVPGIQMLHCLINETRGGLSTLADSLKVLEVLKHELPEGYELLRTIPVGYRFIDAGTELTARRCMIRTDADGNPIGVHYSPRLDRLPHLSPEKTRLFHLTRQRLGELFADPAFEIRFQLNAGELMLFDNSRVLHGRTAFDTQEGRRHIQGCYLDSDGPRERFATTLIKARHGVHERTWAEKTEESYA
ncbi:gamma-butyrobetaine dioxygenase [Marinobacter sp. LV10R510-11A]|uniref:TauD/TfdA family dioxygenase n=1 Tax=Marinobacter sp. LV10R510-11A TaxID=1415568 RepID=UPI000BBFA883|nr:TauD/TfdA family dioxygenase [Marinobacter sp. LV10R510-11A]SOB76198.1 gamma-butyrobetaine dioxygenase [Marinobacter sp. LV10R510-11A]